MPVELFVDGTEPEDQDAEIWRFMNFAKFEDLMKTGELYFCRADLFKQDDAEGLPPTEYLPALRLNPFDLKDIQELNNYLGSAAQFRQTFFINCWYLFSEETAEMWKNFARDGVAICSTYARLKSALASGSERALLGLIRYGAKHLTGWNIIHFVTTKQQKYAHEREVRAILWIMDEHDGMNRHIDEQGRIHPRPLSEPPSTTNTGHRFKVDLNALLTGIVMSPLVECDDASAIIRLAREAGVEVEVRPSELSRYRSLLPLE